MIVWCRTRTWRRSKFRCRTNRLARCLFSTRWTRRDTASPRDDADGELTVRCDRAHVERLESGESECPALAHARRATGAHSCSSSGAQEEHDRAAVSGAGDVCRAQAHAGHGRRPHGGQRAAAAGRPVDQPGAARNGADGLPDLRAGRDRQDVSGRVLCRVDWHSLRHAGQFPLQIRGRDGRESGAGA